MGEKWKNMLFYNPFGQKWEKKLFIHIAAHKRLHESLLCHLKSNNHMMTNELSLLSSMGWMRKTMTNVLKIIVQS
jgi:hypothetical protein